MIGYMANPSGVLEEYIGERRRLTAAQVRRDAHYRDGKLAVALEIVGLIRTVSDMPVVTEQGRAELVSGLETLLVGLGMRDAAWDWYDRLAEWRAPKFLAEGVTGVRRLVDCSEGTIDPRLPQHDALPTEPVLSGISDVDGLERGDLQLSFSSPGEELQGELSPLGDTVVWPEEHRSRGASARHGRSEESDGGR